MAMSTMNRINISLIFLIMIFMVIPASAIMYASGSTMIIVRGHQTAGLLMMHQTAGLLMIMLIHHRLTSFPLTSTHHHLTGLLMIMLIHHRLTSFPLTSTHHHLMGLLMIVVPAHQQRLRKITPLYQVKLR